jgi:hypothetical protein
MKFSKLFIAIISITLTMTIVCQEEAGVKIAVSQNVIEGFEKKLLPLLAQELGSLDIPGTQIDVDAGIGTLHIYLQNIHFQISNLISDNVQISFGEPNKILVNANNINGQGHLNVRFKLGFVSETDSVDVKINRVNSQAEVTLARQESSKVKGKMMPTGYISKLNIDLDFDFNISGSVIAFVAGLVKSKIKNYINDQIQSQLKDKIMSETKNLIAHLVDQLPVYAPIGKDGLAIDYSLLSDPKVSNGYLIANSNGAIVNLNYPETLNPPYPYPTNLPDFDTEGKLIQMYLSDFSLYTALNSVFLSNLLDVTVKSEEVPKDSPIGLNTTSLEILVPGISDVYGKDQLVDVSSKIVTLPQVLFGSGQVNGTVTVEVSLLVRKDQGSEEALRIQTTASLSGDVHVQQEGQIRAFIHYLQLSNSTLIETTVPGAEIKNIEIVFNFAAKIALPIINNKYLNSISINLPSVEGITFNDSTVQIKNNYVEMNVNPQFDQVIMKYVQTRINTKMNARISEDEKLFLNWF